MPFRFHRHAANRRDHFFGRTHHIDVKLDAKALENASIGPDTPVTGKREGISLRSGLRSLLRPIELTYVIRDEGLVITTPDVAANELTTKVYPVGDLITESRRGAGGGRLGRSHQGLINVITSTVAPTTWDEVGGPGSIQEFLGGRSLVVSETDEVHDQIGDLLIALRAARDTQPVPPPPTAGETLYDTVEAISAAWHRGQWKAIPKGIGGRMMGGMGGGMGAGMGGGGFHGPVIIQAPAGAGGAAVPAGSAESIQLGN